MEKSIHRNLLKQQIREAYGQVLFAYSAHLSCVGRIRRRERTVKWLQIGASAITAGGCLSVVVTEETAMAFVSAALSTLTLALASYSKDANLALEGKRHADAAKAFWVMRGHYLSLLTDFDTLSDEKITQERDSLAKQTEQIYAKAPTVDIRSHSDAQRTLKVDSGRPLGEQELSDLLPAYLQ
ncbi:hypothetical protein B5F40_06575 [Gordonibacter sp. An230]|uniref:SLATT domain-containing protein n=1 Tax=Gordonibacter sp. An230 TaxID=1965592 RepID=UPI000B3771D4|nr:SLATT domain-containing protein [Gordonibacter sp. An230]OUO90613.1 hypothetical protein B5F40_06575 [Gordonibacter sp. An230]